MQLEKRFYEKQDDLNKLGMKVWYYTFRHPTKQMKMQAITMHFGQKVRQKCQPRSRKEGRLTGWLHFLEARCLIFLKFCPQRNGLTSDQFSGH